MCLPVLEAIHIFITIEKQLFFSRWSCVGWPIASGYTIDHLTLIHCFPIPFWCVCIFIFSFEIYFNFLLGLPYLPLIIMGKLEATLNSARKLCFFSPVRLHFVGIERFSFCGVHQTEESPTSFCYSSESFSFCPKCPIPWNGYFYRVVLFWLRAVGWKLLTKWTSNQFNGLKSEFNDIKLIYCLLPWFRRGKKLKKIPNSYIIQ